MPTFKKYKTQAERRADRRAARGSSSKSARTLAQARGRILSKKQELQTRRIAKNVVMAMSESKYFRTNPLIFDQSFVPAWGDGTTNSQIGVFGFITGSTRNFTSGDHQTDYIYGKSAVGGNNVDMTSLDLNRVFSDQNSSPQRASYSVIGSSCRPAYAECTWTLDRKQGNVTSDPEDGLLYKIRMIRARPRQLKASSQQCDPRRDMFLDQYNEPFGIATVNDAGANVFGPFEFNMAKANSRRYEIIEDKTFNMGNAGNHFVYNTTGSNQVTDGFSSCFKKFKTKHSIGEELFYEDPNNLASENNSYPDAGFEPEFVLFHVLAIGNPETEPTTADLIRLSARPLSTFKDL